MILVSPELLQAVYLSPEVAPVLYPMIEGARIYRTNISGRRYYRVSDGKIRVSLTTFIDYAQQYGDVRFLNSWRDSMIEQLQNKALLDAYVQSTADYGTLLHIAVSELCKRGELDVWGKDGLFYMFQAEATRLGWGYEVAQSAFNKFLKDFACVSKFFHDYEVRIIAVELPVFDDLLATCIDLVVEMNAKNYKKTKPEKRERINALINLKSGKHTGDTHALQCAGEKRLFNFLYGELFPGFERTFILKPKDFEKEPGYDLIETTSEQFQAEFDALVALTKTKAKGVLTLPRSLFFEITGKFVYGEDPSHLVKQKNFETHFENIIELSLKAESKY